MKFAWIIAAVLTAHAVGADDWRATLTPIEAGSFPVLRPLQSTYKFGWGKLDAATADIDFTKTSAGLLKLELKAKSEGVVRSLWRMDARQVALCQPATLRPMSTEQVETYKKETLTTTLGFGPEGVARLRVANPPDKNPPRTKQFKFPAIFDMHSALLFVRSKPLAAGDVVRIVVYPTTDPYLAEVEVLERGTIKIGKESRAAIKLGIKLRSVTKKFELEAHDKFKGATAWLSDDGDRLLLRIEAEIFVGSVWAEMESVKFTEP